MAADSQDPFGLNQLNDKFNAVLDEIENGVSSALGALHDLIDGASPDDFDVVHDAIFAIFQNTAEEIDMTASFFAELFSSWASAFRDSKEAIADMVRRLFDQFSDNAAFFRRAMTAFVALFDDFAKFFARLAKTLLAETAEVTNQISGYLLSVLASGAAVFGTDVAADALSRVMRDPDPVLTAPATAFEIGLPPSGLPQLSLDAFGSTNLTLPMGVWLAASMLDALRQAGGFVTLMANAPTGNALLDEVLSPLTGYFGQIATDYLSDVEDLAEGIIRRLVEQAENDAELEWILLKLARFTPVGIFILVIAAAVKLVTSPAPWLNLLLNPIESDPNLKVRRLTRPDQHTKYVVFSDVHRDEQDSERPKYQFGSIDHFLRNENTYLELLKYHAENGYVIIEAGDCEELWFHRDFTVEPPEKLKQIIETNRDIYELQRELHEDGRYFRVYGNHDSYLRDPETAAVLKEVMEGDDNAEFIIYDFIIIESVKTMHDVPFYLGLNSAPNSARLPLIVTHGHQWDFWNCDANNILGKIIVSAVVTPLDMLDDPFRDIGGLSSFGTPLTNFKQIISNLPVYNSWQSYEPGVQKLDHIQHMEDNDRVFTDDIQYSETLASLMGLLIPLAHNPADDSLPFVENPNHLFNLMSIGHTHNPHNMPYYDLGELPFLKPIAAGLEAQITAASAGLFSPQVGRIRSNYINTGVSGWYHECFWALDLGDQSHGSGQPKLVNWTYNTRLDRPNHMDWELPFLPEDGIEGPGEIVDEKLRALLTAGRTLMNDGKDRALEGIASLPVSDVLRQANSKWVPQDLKIGFDQGRSQIDALMVQLAMALMPETKGAFEAVLQLPKPIQQELSRLMKQRLPGAATSKRRRLCAAISTLAVTQGMVRFGLRGQPGGPEAAATGLLLLLMQLVEAKQDRIDVEMSLISGTIRLRVAFADSDPTAKPTREIARRETAKRRGVAVRAFLQDNGMPMKGWTVTVERKTGRKVDVVASSRLDATGEAMLLTGDLGGQAPTRLKSALSLALYPPKSARPTKTPVTQLALSLPLDMSKPISLPVSFRQLQRAGFYRGSKLRGPDQKLKDLCDGWKKRLSDQRDPHAKDELCLQDLVMTTVGALDAPKTALEKKASKLVKQQLKDTGPLPEVAKLAREARKNLKDCLGGAYVTCDATGSIADIGKRLIKGDLRFDSLVKFFGNPTPDPLLTLPTQQPGLGLPSGAISFNKICLDRAETGDLDDALSDQMSELQQLGLLATPSINRVNVWDPGLGGGEISRVGDIPEKTLTLRAVEVSGSNVEIIEREHAMDVELDDPNCLILQGDASNRQIMATDVKPGQTVTLFGSGLVSAEAEIQASFQSWEAGDSDGRLVPDDTVLPVVGLGGLTVPVFGRQLPVEDNATPTTYNGDTVMFRWPDAAGQPGLYRIRLTCKNESVFPTTVTQNEDCTLVVGRGDVTTGDVFFVVLPAPASPPVRAIVEDILCEDLTDPEHVLGIPWPDDLLLVGTTSRLRVNVPTDGSDPTEEILDTFFRQDGQLLFGPGTWTPAMKLFPQNTAFSDLDLFESVSAHFELLEVEGTFDAVVVGVIVAVIAIVIVLIVAAIIIAVILAFAEPTPLAEIALAALLSFVFGAAFTSLSTAFAAITTSLNGNDRILHGAVQLSGHALRHDQSPIRFQRLMTSRGDLQGDVPPLPDLSEEFDNEVLGGRYRVQMRVETED